ncbi:hypothetical protein BRC94_04385, partial [Halobacteriales archaeon QS_5_70_17]
MESDDYVFIAVVAIGVLLVVVPGIYFAYSALGGILAGPADPGGTDETTEVETDATTVEETPASNDELTTTPREE